MLQVMLILIAASIGLGLSAKFRVPSIPLMILAGIFLGMTGWMGESADLENTLLLGLTFLLFIIGAELDFEAIGNQKRAALGFGLVQFTLLGGVSLVAARLMDFDTKASLYIGLAIASSSTLIVVTLLRRREQFFESFGRLAIGVVLLQDLLVILLLPVLTGENTTDSVQGVGATAGLIVLAVIGANRITPKIMLRLEHDEESLLLVMLAMLFGFVGLAHWLGIPEVTGAFLAGLALSRFPVSGLVRGQLGSLADFFLALFFVSLGVLMGMIAPLLDAEQVIFNAILLAAILLFAPFLLVPLARRFGLTTRSSIEVTNLLAQSGELSLVVVLLGRDSGHIDEGVLGTIVLITVITMVVSPLLSSEKVTWRIMHLLPGPRRLGVSVDHHDHLIFIGCGTSTRDLIRQAAATGERVVAVDDDGAVIEELTGIDGVEPIRGDGADPWLLRRLGVRDAKLIVSTMRHKADHERLLRLCADTPVILRTFEHDDAIELRGKGARVISESDEAERVFLKWFDQRDDPAIT